MTSGSSNVENPEVPTYHFGVYARIVSNGAQLFVRKTRGPYRGLLDLPGGKPEVGESWHETLRRELYEELGVREFAVGKFTEVATHVSKTTCGADINFHHHGVVADVFLNKDALEPGKNSEDTAGWEWVRIDQLSPGQISSFANAAGKA
jgi:ADP-ribose pyrophosphatase YjhB (NUDIX family)